MKRGKLLVSGLIPNRKMEEDPKGKSEDYLTSFHKFTSRTYRFIASSKYGTHSIFIDENGEAFGLGENKHFQCGQSDLTKMYELPTPIASGTLKGINVVQAACGRHHSLFLSGSGQVYACGDNTKGQCGIGRSTRKVKSPQLIDYDGAEIVKIDCGADFSVILDVNGKLYAFGSPEFGQLGNNTNGEYFVTNTKLSFHYETKPMLITSFVCEEQRKKMKEMQDVRIKDFACGKFHTAAIDANGALFTWGFGGNGQLGHNTNQNEYRPRLVKYLVATRNVISNVFSGSKYTIVLTISGNLFMFGAFGKKNFMYPQQNELITGYKFTNVGCSESYLATATDGTVVVQGTSPTYGELGIGDNPRSSAVPTENVHLRDLKIIQIVMGRTHSMLLVDTVECSVTKKKYMKFPSYSPLK